MMMMNPSSTDRADISADCRRFGSRLISKLLDRKEVNSGLIFAREKVCAALSMTEQSINWKSL